jgi:hypothetical protein
MFSRKVAKKTIPLDKKRPEKSQRPAPQYKCEPLEPRTLMSATPFGDWGHPHNIRFTGW